MAAAPYSPLYGGCKHDIRFVGCVFVVSHTDINDASAGIATGEDCPSVSSPPQSAWERQAQTSLYSKMACSPKLSPKRTDSNRSMSSVVLRGLGDRSQRDQEDESGVTTVPATD